MPLSTQLLDNAIQAAVAAIEIYNKPSFTYREEAFSLLMVNAWELLLKAKWIQENGENIESLYTLDDAGKPKLNRSKNPITHSLGYLLAKLSENKKFGVDSAVLTNLEGLVEIRDNSVHFVNKNLALGQAVLEVGTAAIQNFVQLSREWFDADLSRYNFYLMPLAFYHGFEVAASASLKPLNAQAEALVTYLRQLEAKVSDTEIGPGRYVACRIETKLCRAKDATSVEVRYTDDPKAPAVIVKEEEILKIFPWNYRTLTERLKSRYSNFVENRDYHKIRKQIEGNNKLSVVRFLSPGNPKSPKTRFYSPNIVQEFDKHYEKNDRVSNARLESRGSTESRPTSA